MAQNGQRTQWFLIYSIGWFCQCENFSVLAKCFEVFFKNIYASVFVTNFQKFNFKNDYTDNVSKDIPCIMWCRLLKNISYRKRMQNYPNANIAHCICHRPMCIKIIIYNGSPQFSDHCNLHNWEDERRFHNIFTVTLRRSQYMSLVFILIYTPPESSNHQQPKENITANNEKGTAAHIQPITNIQLPMPN